MPVRASVYPAGSGTVTGTGDITLDGSTRLTYDNPEHPWDNAVVQVKSIKLGLINFGMFSDFTVYGTDKFDYDLTSWIFTQQWEPFPDGTNVQVCIYPHNLYTIEGPKIVANGATVNLRIVGVDLTEKQVRWWRVDPSQPSELVGTGETCSFVKTRDVEIIEVGVDDL